MAFKPALIVVDMQNDTCHPEHGAVAVPGGALDLIEPINKLLAMPGFAFKVATMNAHPDDHKAFAHNYQDAVPHETHVDLPNTKPGSEHETVKQKLWPKCCQPGTKGHELVEGLDEASFDMILMKNQHSDVTQYATVLSSASGFPFPPPLSPPPSSSLILLCPTTLPTPIFALILPSSHLPLPPSPLALLH